MSTVHSRPINHELLFRVCMIKFKCPNVSMSLLTDNCTLSMVLRDLQNIECIPLPFIQILCHLLWTNGNSS